MKTEMVITDRSGSLREILAMSAPLIVSFISFSLMGLVDTVIMGRVGTAEQGAVGLGGMLTWGVATLFTGTMTVVNTFVAQDFGAGSHANLRRHVHAAAAPIPVFCAALWIVIPFLPAILPMMGISPEVRPHVGAYMSIRLLGAPFLFSSFIVVSFLRGLGDMRTPMIVTIASNAVNAVLAVVLVFGLLGLPRMGVAGAATASLMAGAFETALYLLAYFGKKNNGLYATRALGLPSAAEVRRFLRVGLPIGFAWMFDMMSWMLFSIYASTKPPSALAAHMIIFQVIHFSFLPVVGVSVAATTLVGQYLGARRPGLAQRSASNALGVGAAYMALTGLVMAFCRRPLVAAFNPAADVVAVGAQLMLIAAIFQPFDGVGMTIGGTLRGAGDTRYPMLAMLASGCLVFIPGVFLLGERLSMGIVGAWLAALAYIVAVAFLMAVRFIGGRWKRMADVPSPGVEAGEKQQ